MSERGEKWSNYCSEEIDRSPRRRCVRMKVLLNVVNVVRRHQQKKSLSIDSRRVSKTKTKIVLFYSRWFFLVDRIQSFPTIDDTSTTPWANATLSKVGLRPPFLLPSFSFRPRFSLWTISKGSANVRSIRRWFGHASTKHRNIAKCRCHGVASSVVARRCSKCSTNRCSGPRSFSQLFRSFGGSGRSRRYSSSIGLFASRTKCKSPFSCLSEIDSILLFFQRFYKKAAAFVLRAVAKHSPQLAQSVIDCGALDALVVCLEEFDPSVKEAATWALGYIARHNAGHYSCLSSLRPEDNLSSLLV